MIRHGLRLRDVGSARVTWRDLFVIVTCAPEGSPLAAALAPAAAVTTDTLFLRGIEHSLRWLVWSKTQDAQHGRGVPDPIRFPWEDAADTSGGWVGEAMTAADMNEALGWTDLVAAENERRAAAGDRLIPT